MLHDRAERIPRMISPPYQLRPHKAVDRFLLIETLKRLPRNVNINKYQYHGFGGPFLEDFKLLHSYFPDTKMNSIEQEVEVLKRQREHVPCKNIKLHRSSFSDYLNDIDDWDKNHIFWLDYNGLDQSNILDFQRLADKIAPDGIIKVTVAVDHEQLRQNPYRKSAPDEKEIANFHKTIAEKFGAFSPATFGRPDFSDAKGYLMFVQNMFRLAADRVLSPGSGKIFQILSSSFYKDSTRMLSLIGVVCTEDKADTYVKEMKQWSLSNTDWSAPKGINVPFLSFRERMKLDRCLPTRSSSGRTLFKRLGYNIGNSDEESMELLGNYASFYRYYPNFAKVIS